MGVAEGETDKSEFYIYLTQPVGDSDRLDSSKRRAFVQVVGLL